MLPVIDRERGSDDWIITTTNGTYSTRERGSDDWIITTTNETCYSGDTQERERRGVMTGL